MARPTRGRGKVRGAGPVHGGPRHAPPPGPTIMAAARSLRGPLLVPIGGDGKGLFLLAPSAPVQAFFPVPPPALPGTDPSVREGGGAGGAGSLPGGGLLGRWLGAASRAAGRLRVGDAGTGPVPRRVRCRVRPWPGQCLYLVGFFCFLGNPQLE